MRTFFILFFKELRSFFLSPLAWVVIALFTFLNGWLFASMVNAMRLQVSARSLVYNLFQSGWFWMGFFVLFPLLTMRLFAEERKMGTIEGLLTAPVRTSEVVLAKYAATVVVYVVTVLPVFGFFPIFQLVRLLKNPATENRGLKEEQMHAASPVVRDGDPRVRGGCGPFSAWLRCSSVVELAPLLRRALPAEKMTRSFPSRGFSTVS